MDSNFILDEKMSEWHFSFMFKPKEGNELSLDCLQVGASCRHCKRYYWLKHPIAWDEWQAWRHGTLIQDAFKNLEADEREFLISRMCGICFDVVFSDPDDFEEEI